MNVAMAPAAAAYFPAGPAYDPERVWYNISYHDKEDAKAQGARWDPVIRRWYAPSQDVALLLDEHWQRVDPPAADIPPGLAGQPIPKTFFAVGYDQRHLARGVGSRWDAVARLWYTTDAGVARALEALGFEERDGEHAPADAHLLHAMAEIFGQHNIDEDSDDEEDDEFIDDEDAMSEDTSDADFDGTDDEEVDSDGEDSELEEEVLDVD